MNLQLPLVARGVLTCGASGMGDHKARIALGCVLLLGVGLRLIHIGDPFITDAHSWRQSDTAAFTHRYLNDTLNPLDPRVDRYPCAARGSTFGRVEAELPVGSWLAALPLSLLRVTCPSPIYLRLVSVLFFLGAASYLFLLVSRLAGDWGAGVMSALVLSVLPLSLYFTRTVQPEAPSLFFSMAFLYHLLRWLESDSRTQGVLSAALGALVLLQKISNAVLLAPALYLIIAQVGCRRALRRPWLWVWGLAVLLPAVAWYINAHHQPWGFGIWFGSGKYSAWKDINSAETWKLFSDRAVFEIFTWAGVVLVVLGFTRFRQSLAVRVAAVWLAAQLAFLVLTIPVHRVHVYYQLGFELPAAIVIAAGAQWLWQQRVGGKVVLVGLLALHSLQTWHAVSIFYRRDQRLEMGIALLKLRVPREATIVSSDRNPALFSNSCHKAWFLRERTLGEIESCVGNDVSYLLLDAPLRHELAREDELWRRLQSRFVEVDWNAHFSIWRRSPRAAAAVRSRHFPIEQRVVHRLRVLRPEVDVGQ